MIETALLVFGHAHEDEPVVVELVALVLHHGDDVLLDVFVAQQDLLEELVELAQLLISRHSVHGGARALNPLISNAESVLVLGQDFTRRLLLYIFELLLDVGHLAVVDQLARADESLKLVALDQVRDLTQL